MGRPVYFADVAFRGERLDAIAHAGAETAPEVGRRQALAAAASAPAWETAPGAPARRAVLRRHVGGARPDAAARAVERHQPASHQLLRLGETRAPREHSARARSRHLLRTSGALQRAARARRRALA